MCNSNQDSRSFKCCPKCNHLWLTREAFLLDPEVTIIGYQVNFDSPGLGLFLFNHTSKDCRTTLALQVSAFADLHRGPVYREPLTGTQQCPGYCLNRNDLRPCPEKCACAYVRELIQVLKNWSSSRRCSGPP